MKEIYLDIVVVTYNRLEKLKIALQHYCDQTVPFRNLIIVNNCSNDGTAGYLEEWIAEVKKQDTPRFCPILISTDENLGGSGGFYLGEKRAMELGADWVMVADDDAYAEPNMVEEFYRSLDKLDCTKISAVCAAVCKPDGNIALHHRSRWNLKEGKYFQKTPSVEEDYTKELFQIDLFSYVGTFLNCLALRKVGLVNPDYFIYYDDSEHSFRMKKYGQIVVSPNIQIVHEEISSVVSNELEVSWRDYYYCRNKFHMFFHHLPIVACRYMWWQIRDWYLGRIPHTAWNMVENTAKWDALLGRLGKHPLYKPGWSIKK